MRPWRDIISANMFRSLAGSHTHKVQSLGYMGDLNRLASLIQKYHSITKDDLNTINTRIASLGTIAAHALKFMQDYKVDMQKARARNIGKHEGYYGHMRDKQLHTFMESNPKLESFERNLLTLHRRAMRKAAYLESLARLYSNQSLTTTEGFLNRITVQKLKDTKHYKQLDKAVLLEQMDPGHRTFEMIKAFTAGEKFDGLIDFVDKVDDSLLDESIMRKHMPLYLTKWLRESIQAPFYLWLETQPICDGDKKRSQDPQMVNYVKSNGGKTIDKLDHLMLVIFDSSMQMIRVGEGVDKKRIASTVKPHLFKSLKAPDGQAAYVWSKNKELFIGEHTGNYFHHSSFVSGEMVRCAGMIQIENGKVTYVNNFSGHYKPGTDYLKQFCKFLIQKKAITKDTMVEKISKHGQKVAITKFV